MASSRDRQRKLAREKLDRQMSRRAGQERRRRRIQAGVGAGLAVLLIVAGVAWLGGAFDADEKPAEDPAAAEQCAWNPQDASANKNLKDVGTPATQGLPSDGTAPMTVTTDQGAPIEVTLDLAAAPCAAGSLSYLAGKKFYDNTECTEITDEGAVRCGDPSGTGQGGPAYGFYTENLPVPADKPSPAPSASAAAKTPPTYPAGTVALMPNPPGTNGSQFLMFFKDFDAATPQYTVVGKITKGLDTLTKISKIPTVADAAGAKDKPKTKITVKTLTVGGQPAQSSPAPSASSQS